MSMARKPRTTAVRAVRAKALRDHRAYLRQQKMIATKLHPRAVKVGGSAFADALCDIVEDAQFRRRVQARGGYPPIQSATERKEVKRIFAAAHKLMRSLWQASPDTRRNLFTARQTLLATLDGNLDQLLDLAEDHVAELPRTNPPDYVRAAILMRLLAVFADHGVRPTQTASKSENKTGSVRTYTSLAVDAVMVIFDADADNARAMIRSHLKTTGSDSTAE